ncbi:hypothetical protein AB4305_16070 [Nocardia sp. 2YAB30]
MVPEPMRPLVSRMGADAVAIATSTAAVLLDWFRPVDTAHGL